MVSIRPATTFNSAALVCNSAQVMNTTGGERADQPAATPTTPAAPPTPTPPEFPETSLPPNSILDETGNIHQQRQAP